MVWRYFWREWMWEFWLLGVRIAGLGGEVGLGLTIR